LYWDAVLNQRCGADEQDEVPVVEVEFDDRNKEISDEHKISAWMHFTYPGRKGKYSDMQYRWYHFTGTDYNAGEDRSALYRVTGVGKGWAEDADPKNGNDDYVMAANVDYKHPDVREDVVNWGRWIVQEVGLSGFRIDACSHLSREFFDHFITEVNASSDKELFWVGEIIKTDTKYLTEFIDKAPYKLSLYDHPLLDNFASISKSEKSDLRKVFDNTLVSLRPISALTHVTTHDTQAGSTAERTVDAWMKPLAYSLILLRFEGYPCVFYGDLYGTKGDNSDGPACGHKLADMMLARKLFAYGEQNDYWDQPNCIGFVRRGTSDRPDGLACVLSNAGPGQIQMHVGPEHKGEIWTDILGWQQDEITISDDGNGIFPCPGVSVSIWVNKDAKGREQFPTNFRDDIYTDFERLYI